MNLKYQISISITKLFFFYKKLRKEEHRTDKESTVFKHVQEMGHEMNWEEMKILDSARDDYRLRLKEMMYINKLKPELNVQKSSQMFSLLLNGGKDS